MKREASPRSWLAAGLTCLLTLVVATTGNSLAAVGAERPAAVAGRFYPADSGRLTRAVRAFLAEAIPPCGERPIALVSPHAGYIYSGQVCADAWRQAADFDYELIVLLGTNHTQPPFAGVSLYDGAGYRTPLGLAEIDRQTTTALLRGDPACEFRPAVHRQEHSVEVQVPFAQILFPGVKILAAVVGSPDPETCARFGKALSAVLQGRKALIVASCDLAHYPDYQDAVASDAAVLTAIAGLDPDRLQATVAEQMRKGRPDLSTCACGLAPVRVAMVAAGHLGATAGTVVSYANSGDSSVGDHSRVVGYGAVVLSAGSTGPRIAAVEAAERAAAEIGSVLAAAVPAPGGPGSTDGGLSRAGREALLQLARQTIGQYFETETTPLARGLPASLYRRQGAFVTLKKQGRLRGCIGHMAQDRPLCQVVAAMALAASFNDSRFPALKQDELDRIQIEISVLTPFQRVSGPAEIVPGRDGVRLQKGGRSAVYLPQVATEQGWGLEEMLDHLCQKAGLAPGDWRDGAELQSFQAEVFGESGLR